MISSCKVMFIFHKDRKYDIVDMSSEVADTLANYLSDCDGFSVRTYVDKNSNLDKVIIERI